MLFNEKPCLLGLQKPIIKIRKLFAIEDKADKDGLSIEELYMVVVSRYEHIERYILKIKSNHKGIRIVI